MTDQQERKATPPSHTTGDPVLVVGIGASAGGLAAFKQFLTHTPADTGMTFVLLPHLDPAHESAMKELMSTQTPMPVSEVSEGQSIQPNHVYVVAPAHGLDVRDGKFHLTELELPKYRWTVVDRFLRTLAAEFEERSVGILLSGTGRHGIAGLQKIKAVGGLVLAQNPESCAYPEMPSSAIDAGMVDLILIPEEMPAALIDYANHSYLAGDADEVASDPTPAKIDRILNILRSRGRLDFRNFRKNMLTRRIMRRMSLHHFHTLHEYEAFLRDHAEEQEQLCKDLLIGVTAFFRDPEAFQVLEKSVMPTMIENINEDQPLRVWVPACATGEEAYSLGMLLIEAFTAADKTPRLQIFATDIDEEALAKARQGVYSTSAVADISPTRLQRFFVKEKDDSYRISQSLRDAVVFAGQSLINDAPFSHLDLISCRNLLIYLEPDMQARIIELLHFALNDNGVLMLGPSESLGRHSELFELISKKWRIFKYLPSIERRLLEIPQPDAHWSRLAQTTTAIPGAKARINFGDLTLKLLLPDYAPASVMINRNYEVLHFFGPTSEYLEIPGGEPTMSLLPMLRQGLGSRVRNIAQHAWQDGKLSIDTGARVKRNGAYHQVRISARPVPKDQFQNQLLLLSFEEAGVSAVGIGRESGVGEVHEEEKIIEQLEYELKATREDLQSNVEELESSNEELKVTNEEMMSINEELQSANEELETSKEELQSMNEELNTVNSELQSKVEELEARNDDISNLLASTDIATLFLDRSMQIKLFNPPVADLMNLRPGDIDRPVSDIAGKVETNEFSADARQVLERLAPVERIVAATGGAEQVYLRRMVPYRASNDRIGGVVITYVDFTERFNQERLLEQRVEERSAEALASREQLSLVLNAAGAAVWEMDANKKRELVSVEDHRVMFRDLPTNPKDSWDWWIENIHPDDRSTIQASLERALASDTDHWEEIYRFCVGNGQYHWVSDIAHISQSAAGQSRRVTGAMIDINKRRELELALRTRDQRWSAIIEHTTEAVIVFNRNGQITDFNPGAERMFACAAEQMLHQPVSELIADSHRDEYEKNFDYQDPLRSIAILTRQRQLFGKRGDGSVFPVNFEITELLDLDSMICVARDLSRQTEVETEVGNIATWEQENTGRELHDGLGQRLTGLRLLAAKLKQRLDHLDLPESEQLGSILDELKAANAEVSRISRGLAPISISPKGLADAIASLVEFLDSSSSVRLRFVQSPDFNVDITDAAVANQLYRITQEAMNNALKYADASTITVSVGGENDSLEISVVDDGVGFNMDETESDAGVNLGLRIMRHRANNVGALLNIDSTPGKGTEINCRYLIQDSPDVSEHADTM